MSGERQRQVVLQADDAGEFYALRRLQRISSNGRPDGNFIHFHCDAEILESALDDVGVGFNVSDAGFSFVILQKRQWGRDIRPTA